MNIKSAVELIRAQAPDITAMLDVVNGLEPPLDPVIQDYLSSYYPLWRLRLAMRATRLTFPDGRLMLHFRSRETELDFKFRQDAITLRHQGWDAFVWTPGVAVETQMPQHYARECCSLWKPVLSQIDTFSKGMFQEDLRCSSRKIPSLKAFTSKTRVGSRSEQESHDTN